MLTVAHLIQLADEYQRVGDPPLSDTTLSFKVFGDSKKLAGLRDGAVGITVDRFNRAVSWFAANWPDKAEWPDEIERPTRVAA